jgi:hypothetical protein
MKGGKKEKKDVLLLELCTNCQVKDPWKAGVAYRSAAMPLSASDFS